MLLQTEELDPDSVHYLGKLTQHMGGESVLYDAGRNPSKTTAAARFAHSAAVRCELAAVFDHPQTHTVNYQVNKFVES